MNISHSPISFCPDEAFVDGSGLDRTRMNELADGLQDARQEMMEVDRKLWESGGEIPPEKTPLDAGFVELPKRILTEYHSNRPASELAAILGAARQLQERVDRVVTLGIGGSYMGAYALMQACCQPYFNELSRAGRGGKPRMYFEGNNVDNDATQGLLHLLSQPSATNDPVSNDWAIIVISKSGGTIETAVSLRQFLGYLERQTDADSLAERVVPVTGSSGKLHELAQSLGCRHRFLVPEGVGGRFSIFSAVGLLPSAVLGLDVVALLKGAADMTQRFQDEPPGANPVIDYVATNIAAEEAGHSTRVLSLWNKSLEWIGLWYDQLLAESLGKQERGALPLTVVNTRDLHSRAQQHQEGRRDKIFNNVIVEQWRFDPLMVGHRKSDVDELNQFAQRTLPELMNAAVVGTNQAYRDAGRPTTDIRLPAVDEYHLGQLLQMMMLATVLEGRYLGINPYGQPGVEMYKTNMKSILNS